LAGVDTTPNNNKNKTREQRDRQDMARIAEAARSVVLSEQNRLGRQMTATEIDVVMGRLVGQLQWERPTTWAYRGTQGFVTSYANMPEDFRRRERDTLKSQGIDNPTEDQIFLSY